MTLQIKSLSIAMAKKMADAAEAKAIEKNIKVIISILDAGGNLKYFRRMDGTSFGSIQVSQLKANTSASFPLSTKALAERNLQANGAYGGRALPGIILLEGGLSIITSDDQHLGGIGISGATGELDAICAQAGLEAIKEELL